MLPRGAADAEEDTCRRRCGLDMAAAEVLRGSVSVAGSSSLQEQPRLCLCERRWGLLVRQRRVALRRDLDWASRCWLGGITLEGFGWKGRC